MKYFHLILSCWVSREELVPALFLLAAENRGSRFVDEVIVGVFSHILAMLMLHKATQESCL